MASMNQAFKKVVSFERLGLPDILHGEVYEGLPCNFLADFDDARRAYYEDRATVLYNASEKRYSVSPVRVRGTTAYEHRVKSKVRRIGSYVISQGVSCSFVTFSSWAPEGLSPWEMFQRWDGFVNSFFSWLQHREGVRYQYVWAIEPTKRGYCHIHLIILGCARLDFDAVFKWFNSQPVGIGSNHHALRIDHVPEWSAVCEGRWLPDQVPVKVLY